MSLADYVAEESRCPACGALIDYCLGHGECGDPAGFAILEQHDVGQHDCCHPSGCEEAREAVWDNYIPGTKEGD